jgi:hypothetical protein
MMRLALLLDRRYAPYQKWLGTAFARSRHHDALPEHMSVTVTGSDAAERQNALGRALTTLARRHDDVGLTEPVDPRLRPFQSRPAVVLMCDRFADATRATVTDPYLAALPLVGSVDQAVDSTDVLSDPDRFRRLASLYTVP